MQIAGKFLCLFGAAISLAGCDDLVQKAYDYKMPASTAWQKLTAAPVNPSGKGPFGRLAMEMSGKKNELVEWKIKGSSTALCTAGLKPREGEQTRVDVSCRDFGDGAGAGITATLIRNAVIEFVDATLRDRPYDPMKAEDGFTAARWPKDVIDHGTIGTAAGRALEMERKMALELQEMRNSSSR
jgi:hypothetical protein